MRVRINIDFEVSPRVKRALRIAVPALVILGASVAYAAVPNTFKDGDALSAQTMNDNFTALDQRLAKVEALTNKATSDGGYSLGATYCGATGNTMGDLSALPAAGAGYAKAKAQCQTTCNSPSAHLCTSEEITRSSELGMTIPSGWYSTAVYMFSSTGTYDCFGFTAKANTTQGALWANGTPSYATVTTCDGTNPVLCCN
jgi:hypothetical protein